MSAFKSLQLNLSWVLFPLHSSDGIYINWSCWAFDPSQVTPAGEAILLQLPPLEPRVQVTLESSIQAVVSGSGVGNGERVGADDGANVGKMGGKGLPA